MSIISVSTVISEYMAVKFEDEKFRVQDLTVESTGKLQHIFYQVQECRKFGRLLYIFNG